MGTFKVWGFKLIGQASSAVREFFPGDDDEREDTEKRQSPPMLVPASHYRPPVPPPLVQNGHQGSNILVNNRGELKLADFGLGHGRRRQRRRGGTCARDDARRGRTVEHVVGRDVTCATFSRAGRAS